MRRFLAFLKNPPRWFVAICYVLTVLTVIGAVVCAAQTAWEFPYSIIAYILYALAAVTLSYTVYTIVIFVPKAKRRVREKLQKHTFTNRLLEQYGFRTITFTVVSLAISLVNAVFNGAIGIITLSLWYASLGAYYLLLSLMRGGVLLYHRRKKKLSGEETQGQIKIREINSYRVCGILLIILPLALSFAILEMVASDRAFVHSGMMIYVTALYTCYKVVMSIVNFFKARKGDEMSIQAIRNVNLADAAVSILALQTAMFHEFSTEESIGTANAITGAVVCALTAAMGVFMVIYGSLKIKKLREETENGRQEEI